MTDAEIKKALECCPQDNPNHNCARCAYKTIEGYCFDYLMKDVLDLINRQQEMIDALIAGQETLQKALAEKNAEVERLQKLLDDKCDRCIAKAKAEAIKEFAEAVKMANTSKLTWFNEDIDTLVAEMVGDAE